MVPLNHGKSVKSPHSGVIWKFEEVSPALMSSSSLDLDLELRREGSPHATVPPPPRSFRILTDLPSSPGDEWEGLLGFKVLRLTNEHDAMNWRKDLFVGLKRGR
ncbi:hypothetical protein TNCV_563491 [Trichonephila clavipes]|nr:hypothetical protein TNCV_563491 [Trichonephila clavipes]